MNKEFGYSYDKASDVLYTFLDKPEKAYCQDVFGLLGRFSEETNLPCGVTVEEFKTKWADKDGLEYLATYITMFLHLEVMPYEFEILHERVLVKLKEAYNSLFRQES